MLGKAASFSIVQRATFDVAVYDLFAFACP